MKEWKKQLEPSQSSFERDPFGYSSSAWHKWGMFQTVSGFPIDPKKKPTTQDLKSPVLWLLHAQAMSEAARITILGTPNLEHLESGIKGICDCQYRAVGLMLVGYSLEICLKGILIFNNGIEKYIQEEKRHKTHNLVKLSDFVPNLTDKDKAILDLLTHFVAWAGRYPDPGSGRESKASEIFSISEKYEISGKDLFVLSAKIMSYAKYVMGSK